MDRLRVPAIQVRNGHCELASASLHHSDPSQLALYVGLVIGATFFGLTADIFGRVSTAYHDVCTLTDNGSAYPSTFRFSSAVHLVLPSAPPTVSSPSLPWLQVSVWVWAVICPLTVRCSSSSCQLSSNGSSLCCRRSGPSVFSSVLSPSGDSSVSRNGRAMKLWQLPVTATGTRTRDGVTVCLLSVASPCLCS